MGGASLTDAASFEMTLGDEWDIIQSHDGGIWACANKAEPALDEPAYIAAPRILLAQCVKLTRDNRGVTGHMITEVRFTSTLDGLAV
jgi:hypothetical protein